MHTLIRFKIPIEFIAELDWKQAKNKAVLFKVQEQEMKFLWSKLNQSTQYKYKNIYTYVSLCIWRHLIGGWHKNLFRILRELLVYMERIKIIHNLYSEWSASMWTENELSDYTKIEKHKYDKNILIYRIYLTFTSRWF